MRPPTLTIGALALAVAASALVASPASAATATVSTIGELAAAVTSAGTATVSSPISAPAATIAVGSGIVTIDLNGRNVSVQRVEVTQGATLRITNTSATRATFTADASTLENRAAISTTGATLEIGGNADVVATGGTMGGAGVGGDRGNGGGVTKVSGTATLHAVGTGKAAAIGAGVDGGGNILPALTISDTAAVTVEADGGASAIGDSKSVGVVTIGAGATLTIPLGTVVSVKDASGSKLSNSGIIVVEGTLSGESTAVTNTSTGSISGSGVVALPGIQGSAYTIDFDPDGGAVQGSTTITVYADTFAAAKAALPTAKRAGSGFAGWWLGATALNSTTSLSGTLGATKAATALAEWKQSASVSLSPIDDFVFGEKVALTATVADDLNGKVEFFAGDASLGVVTTSASIARLSFTWSLPVGIYPISARFWNDDAAATSDNPEVTVDKGSSALGFATASDTVTAGMPTAVRVNVTPRTATGTVRFTIGTSFVDAVVTDGKATFTTPNTLAAGSYKILATYSGSSDWYSSDDTNTLIVTAATKTSTNTVSSARASDGADGKNGANGADGVSSNSTTTSMITMIVAAKATTVVTISGKKFAKRSKPTLTLKLGTSAVVGGKVVIYVGKKKVKTVTVTKTTMTVKLKKKYAKTLTVRAVFLGTSAVEKASSKAIKLRVK